MRLRHAFRRLLGWDLDDRGEARLLLRLREDADGRGGLAGPATSPQRRHHNACVEALLSGRSTPRAAIELPARERLTGRFLDDYSQLITTVVVPNAIQKDITASARVPAAAVVSAAADRAVLLVYVDQTTAVGEESPTQTNSSVRVTMERVDGRWLIAGFDQI